MQKPTATERIKNTLKQDDTVDAAADDNDNTAEIVYVRIMERYRINPAVLVKEKFLNPMAKKLLPDPNKNSNYESPVNFFTGAKRRDDDDDDDVDDADSVMQSFKDQAAIDAIGGAKEGGEEDGWLPKYKIPLKMFHIVESSSSKKRKTAVVVSFMLKNKSTQREFIFDTEEQAEEFRDIITVNRDTSSVTTMRYMFYEMPSFNADISNWDVSKVENFEEMFYESTSFNQDLSKWDISSGE